MFGRTRIFFVGASLVTLLSACAEAPKKVVEAPPQASLDSLLVQASGLSSSGQTGKALIQLKSAASAYPVDKKPWLQMAQINFDTSNYGDAIINSQEALQRDPTDKLANSIVAVSGLRLSTKALADLSKQNNLSGSVRTEAQDLAKLLRESLGETVLVPVGNKVGQTAKKYSASPANVSVVNGSNSSSRSVLSKVDMTSIKSAPIETKKSNSNPFGSLK